MWAWDSWCLLWPLLAYSAWQYMCCCSDAQGADGQAVATPESWQLFPCIKPGELARATLSLHEKQPWTLCSLCGSETVFHWPGFHRRWSGPGCGAWPRSEVEILASLAHGAWLPPLPAVAVTNRQKIQIKKYFHTSRTINETISRILPTSGQSY